MITSSFLYFEINNASHICVISYLSIVDKISTDDKNFSYFSLFLLKPLNRSDYIAEFFTILLKVSLSKEYKIQSDLAMIDAALGAL